MDITDANLSKRAVAHKSRQTPDAARTNWSGDFPYFPQQIAQRVIHGEAGRFCSQYRFPLLSLSIGGLNHNLQKSLKTGYRSQTATNSQHRANGFDGSFSSFCNKSHTGRYTAKQGSNSTVHIDSFKLQS
jgi:hypothetical protein